MVKNRQKVKHSCGKMVKSYLTFVFDGVYGKISTLW